MAMIWTHRKESSTRAKIGAPRPTGANTAGRDTAVLHRLVDKVDGWLGQRADPATSDKDGPERQLPRVIAVGSGKGGVGKTLVSSSIALGLAEHCGQRVVAIDVDLGGANLHTGLGIKRPSFALNQFILHKTPLRDLSTPSGFRGLEIVSGASDIIGLAEFDDVDRKRFLDDLATFREETVVLDLGAGSSLFNLDLFSTAGEGILVTTTEPTAVQNAYGFLRAAIFRRLRLFYQHDRRLAQMVEDAANHRGSEDSISIPNLIWRISKIDPSAAEHFERLLSQLRIGLLINMTKTREAARVADAFMKTARRYFGVQLDFLGNVDFDTSVRRSVCEWRPLVVHFPSARSTRRLVSVAVKVGSRFDG